MPSIINKAKLLLLAILFWAAPGWAAESADLALDNFFAANKLYDAGQYEGAKEAYRQIIATGNPNAAVWYNLGNSYYRLGENGAAFWAFKEAHKLAPRWNDLDTNMALLQQKVIDELPPLHPAWQKTLFFWHYIFSARERLIMLAVFNLLFWSLFILGKKRPHELTSMGQVIALILTLAMAGSLLQESFFVKTEGVVKNQVAKVHSASNMAAQVLFEIHECTELFVEEEQNGWLLISLSDGKRGWVAADDVAYQSSL